ncbi:MAG: gfo/Idh/MocA family oxidoreductase [Alphaproteobacteria bacterium]|nr:gfo/Idh/MocA family oxidoreductase [Alphaproteobacteria bacterium]
MVGGGQGAFIGAVHRMAARLDDKWELTAGVFQSDPKHSREFGRSLGLAEDRCYGDFADMASAEAKRTDRIDAVSIVTPNHLHVPVARVFVAAGLPVICDKPLGISAKDVKALSSAVRRAGIPFIVTHTYSGYPMVRQARAMIEAGELGKIRVVQVEYAQDWLANDLPENKQADWRGDPERAGPGGALGDIATHAFHLAEFVTGLKASALSADLSTFVEERKVDDNAHVMLRYVDGAKGMLWASQVAAGEANGLRLRIFGERAGLEWEQETPETLTITKLGHPAHILRRGGPGLSAAAIAATRLPAGHPEGYLEAFAQIYSDAAELIHAHLEVRAPEGFAALAPGVEDGVRGVQFIEAAIQSHAHNSAWTEIS